MLLMAVLEKRGGLGVNTCDAYLNVIGGLYLDEPGADLAAVLALASSFRDKPVPVSYTHLDVYKRQPLYRSLHLSKGWILHALPGGFWRKPFRAQGVRSLPAPCCLTGEPPTPLGCFSPGSAVTLSGAQWSAVRAAGEPNTW